MIRVLRSRRQRDAIIAVAPPPVFRALGTSRFPTLDVETVSAVELHHQDLHAWRPGRSSERPPYNAGRV